MLLLFISCTQSKITALTQDAYFSDVVGPKAKNKPWVLVFFTPYCKKYKDTVQALDQASVITNGTVFYGSINCQAYRQICSQFNVETYPTVLIRNRTSHIEFDGALNPIAIAKQALRFVSPSTVKTVDDFWIDDYRTKPTAILFTEKAKVPASFAALSRSLPRSKMRFGICHDEGLVADFNISQVPSIVFYNESATITHEGLRKIRFLKESAAAFLEGRESKSPVHAEFYVNSELPEICYDYTVSCIFSYDNYVDPKLDEVRVHFKNDPFRFFVGTDPLPFPGIQQGDFVIFNAKKMGIIVVKEVAKVTSALDRVIDGGAKWTTLTKYDWSGEL
jgi:hypothetical protein